MESPLGKTPAALGKRHQDVALSDGTTMRVLKWSWAKFSHLITVVGSPSRANEVAIDSVAPEDRERVKEMDPEDIIALAAAGTALNVTPGVLKNLPSLLRAAEALAEAAVEGKKEAPASPAP